MRVRPQGSLLSLSFNCITIRIEVNRMPSNALVQTRIDPDVKERAAVVLGELGITVSDAVRILLTRTANEGALPFSLAKNAAEHDAWFRARVQEALDDRRPDIPHEQVEAHFAKRRVKALRRRKA